MCGYEARVDRFGREEKVDWDCMDGHEVGVWVVFALYTFELIPLLFYYPFSPTT